MRGFRQHTGDVVVIADPMKSQMSPAAEDGTGNDPLDSGFFEFVGDMRAVPGELTPHQWISVGADGIAIWRHVHSCTAAAHLMVVDISLRRPLAVQHLGNVSGFDQIQEVPVPVVIVARVGVIQPG